MTLLYSKDSSDAVRVPVGEHRRGVPIWRAGRIRGMELNPYEAPREAAFPRPIYDWRAMFFRGTRIMAVSIVLLATAMLIPFTDLWRLAFWIVILPVLDAVSKVGFAS